MLDYRLIQALALVIEEGGFERAARRLHLTQSAVSQRVRLLEEQVGRILLVRSSPPRATGPGMEILRHYRQVDLLENGLLGSMDTPAREGYVSLAIGLNGDSLETWFMEAVEPFLVERRVLLDLRVDDQEKTHLLLRDDQVAGCISAREAPLQGCRVFPLGRMVYRLIAAPDLAREFFGRGVGAGSLAAAPLVVYNRKDSLHLQLLEEFLGAVPETLRIHYLPSSGLFVEFIARGLACGMLPDQQSRPFLTSGDLVDLAPGFSVPVDLYWHCWGLDSDLLEGLTRALVRGAAQALEPIPARGIDGGRVRPS